MKYLLFAIMAGAAALGFINGATLGSSKFDYDNATPEERQVWMDEQAAGMKKLSRFFMKNGYGPSAINFYLDEVVTRPERREMETVVRAEIPRGAAVGMVAESALLPKACKSYKRSALYKAGVKHVTSVKNKERGLMMRVSVTPEKCDKVLAGCRKNGRPRGRPFSLCAIVELRADC